MSDIAVTVTSPGSVNATIGVGGAVSATVASGGSVAVNLPAGEAAWANITGKPTEFTPADHTHKAADITDRSTALVTSVNGQTGDITITEGGGGASLSDAAPAALGLAAAGVSLEASRADHVHDLPTAPEVGALDADSVIDGGDYVGYIYANEITITQQPADTTAVDGDATFSVAATVADGSAITYQWEAETLVGGGETWTQRTLPTSASWASAAYGSGVFVALAFDSSIAATSTDGITWTQRTLPVQAFWRSVTYGNGLFVAVAGSGTIAATSPDGTTWTQRALPVIADWYSVTYGNGVFVAVSAGANRVATSPDGTTWTQRDIPAPSANWGSVAYGNGLFITVAFASNAAATSPDGINWTQRTLPASANWYSVTYGNGLFVAVDGNHSNIAATSADGVSWTQTSLPVNATWRRVAYGNGTFLAIAEGVAAATSTDGENWLQRTLPTSAPWRAAAYGDGTFISLAYGNIAATSTDALQFLPISSETSPSLALTGLTVADNGTRYRVVVDSATATAQTSQAATLTVTNAWNLSGPTASASYNVASQTTGPGGVFFKPDGMAMYVVGNGVDGVYQYSLSTAWDVATASLVGSKSVASQDDFPLGIFFRDDGLRMYVSGSGSSDSVHEYTLATAWNVTTATFSQSVSVATDTGIPAGLFFRPDGLKFYVASPFPSRVFEYDLTAAWDVSTALLLNSFVAPSNTEGVFFKPDGLAMFTIDDGGQSTATKYTLSTAWDVSTASLDSSVSLSASVNTPFGLFIKPDGLRMYVSDYNANTVSQFDL